MAFANSSSDIQSKSSTISKHVQKFYGEKDMLIGNVVDDDFEPANGALRDHLYREVVEEVGVISQVFLAVQDRKPVNPIYFTLPNALCRRPCYPLLRRTSAEPLGNEDRR